MSQTCKGICEREKAKAMHWGQRYQLGQKDVHYVIHFLQLQSFVAHVAKQNFAQNLEAENEEFRIQLIYLK